MANSLSELRTSICLEAINAAQVVTNCFQHGRVWAQAKNASRVVEDWEALADIWHAMAKTQALVTWAFLVSKMSLSLSVNQMTLGELISSY